MRSVSWSLTGNKEARASGNRGFMADQIDKSDQMPEPKRSQALRKYRKQVTTELSQDARMYRVAVRDLHRYQAEQADDQQERHCQDVHVAVSLKYCHLYDDFAHLHVLNDLLEKQRNLFDI